jgi:nitrous oxidase accessory protein
MFFWIGTLSGLRADELVVGAGERLTGLREALSAANDGDRIVVRAGRYREGNIVVDKSVAIEGVGFPILDGEGRFEILTVTASGVTVRGFVFRNGGISYREEPAAVKVKDAHHVTIENNRFEDNFFAVYLARSSECRIADNDITASGTRESNTGNGVHLWYCRSVVIENNRITGHRDGIYFEFVKGGVVRSNVSERNLRYGLHFMFSDSCVYDRNTFRKNSAGVAVMYSGRVAMTENLFEDNWGPASYGILLKDIRDSELILNVFHRNTIGLYSEGSTRLRVRRNRFSDNGWAVKIMANSTDNRFDENDFAGNTFDVSTNSRQSFNTFHGNYWSRYSGYDLDEDGVGDVPFRPVRLFSIMVDRYPTALILLRSFFVELLDLAERVLPTLTPETLVDRGPSMQRHW